MGSWLSGRHPLYPSDDLSDCIVLDAASIQRGRRWWTAPRFKSGAAQNLVEVVGISRSNRGGCIRLRISGCKDSQSTATLQEIRLRAVPAQFGGFRWYFECPATMRRQVKLYLPAGCNGFASRKAYSLAYQVGRENGVDRAHRKLGHLYSKLGLSYDGPDSALARRPKGMHTKTFERIARQIEEAENRLETAFQDGLEIISARSARIA